GWRVQYANKDDSPTGRLKPQTRAGKRKPKKVEIDPGVDDPDLGDLISTLQRLSIAAGHRNDRVKPPQRLGFKALHLAALIAPDELPNATCERCVALENLRLDIMRENNRGGTNRTVRHQYRGVREIDDDNLGMLGDS